MQGEEVVYLYLDDIIPNRFQPREVFDEKPLKELAVSIKEHGVIQPIIVRKVNDKYEIIAGERRYKASALAGLTKIPAIIRNLDDKETSKVALLENLQRKNLNPLEEARTYQKILEIDEMTQEELAKTMGKSQSAVANKIRLLSLPEEVQDALLKEKISERHARTLLNVDDGEKQKELLNEIIENKMTVRQLEAKIKGEEPPRVTEEISEQSILNPISIPDAKTSETIDNNFLSSSPLIPTFDQEAKEEPLIISNDLEVNKTNNTEEKKPFFNNDEPKEEPKFINFGEIKEDDEGSESDATDEFYDGDNSSNISFGNMEKSTDTAIDINDLKEKSQDIFINKDKDSNADLDSLLRINNTAPIDHSTPVSPNGDNHFKFFSPAEEAIKESEEKKVEGDYFKAPDLTNVDLPGETPTYNTNNVPLSDTFNMKIDDPSSSYEDKLNDAIASIRDTLSKISSSGIKVEKDEISLSNSYQIIIKLEK